MCYWFPAELIHYLLIWIAFYLVLVEVLLQPLHETSIWESDFVVSKWVCKLNWFWHCNGDFWKIMSISLCLGSYATSQCMVIFMAYVLCYVCNVSFINTYNNKYTILCLSNVTWGVSMDMFLSLLWQKNLEVLLTL